MSHRSEVLSTEQWAAITLLLSELMSRVPPWRSNRQLFEGILWFLRPGVPVGQIYRTHTPKRAPCQFLTDVGDHSTFSVFRRNNPRAPGFP